MTTRQRSLRRRASLLSLRAAVRLAVDLSFRFTHRSTRSTALWSATEQVWLGNRTFLHWALDDTESNIPWVVATTTDAPDSTKELHDVVRKELTDYWEDRLASLPGKNNPRWLPLP